MSIFAGTIEAPWGTQRVEVDLATVEMFDGEVMVTGWYPDAEMDTPWVMRLADVSLD